MKPIFLEIPLRKSSVFYNSFYKFLQFSLFCLIVFCAGGIGFSTDFRWASFDSEGWAGNWSDVDTNSGKTKHWEYSKLISTLFGWDKCDGDFPGYGSVTNASVYFTAENKSVATLTSSCTSELKDLFIGARKNPNETFGSEKVTINLASYELKTENLTFGNSSLGTDGSVNFALAGGGTLTVSSKMTFAASSGCTYNIEIGENTVLDIADFVADVSGVTINFTGKGTLKLKTATFSDGEINFKLAKIEISGATEISNSATVNFTDVSSVSFAGELKNSGKLNFSVCPTVEFTGGLTNDGELVFSGDRVSAISGKITNSGTLTLGQAAKTTFSGEFENLASGILLCNETAETTFSGEFVNSGKVTLNGSAVRTFSSFENRKTETLTLPDNSGSSVCFSGAFSNSGTINSSGLCAVAFTQDANDSGTWIYTGGDSGGTVVREKISYNILILRGNLTVSGDLTAKEIKIETESLGIQGKTTSDSIEINTEKTITLDSETTINSVSILLLTNSKFKLNGKNLVFGTDGRFCSVSSPNTKNLTFEGNESGSKVNFCSAVFAQGTSSIGDFYSTSPVEFNCDVYANTLVAKNNVEIHSGKIVTSKGQEYSAVTISGASKTEINAGGAVTFDGLATFGAETYISASDVHFYSTLNSFSGAKVSINAQNAFFHSSITLAEDFSVSASQATFYSDLTASAGNVLLLANTIFSANCTVSVSPGTFSVGNSNSENSTTIAAEKNVKFKNISPGNFQGNFTNAGTADFEECSDAEIKFQAGFTNEETGTVTLPDNSGSSVCFSGAFSNSGTINSSGLCAVAFTQDANDSGTWIYTGGDSGGTVVREKISYNILILRGNLTVSGDLTAKDIQVETEKLNIQGEINSDSIEINTEKTIVLDENATIHATSVSLLKDTTFDVDGKNLVFGSENAGSSIISVDKRNFVILDSASGGKTIFYSSLGSATSPLGKISSAPEISFKSDVYADSMEAKGAAQISSSEITTTNGQNYLSSVTISGAAKTEINAGGAVTFNGTVETLSETEITAKSLAVTFYNIVNFSSKTAIFASSGAVRFEKAIKVNEELSIKAKESFFCSSVEVSGNVNISGLKATVQFDSDFVSSGISFFDADVYFSADEKNNVEISAEKISVGSETVEKNLYISVLSEDGNSAKNINWKSPVDVSGNFVLLNGNLTLLKNSSGKEPDISAGKDIVLLNGDSSLMYDDEISDKFYWRSGAKNIFKYCGDAVFPGKFPDGTEISSEKFISSLSGLGGNTISAGQNFYCNGANLEGDSEWNLKAGDNENSENFAVVYNSSIENCAYSSSGSGNSYFATAEATDNGGNNENVCFGHPEISFARTIYDDVVEVSFKDSVSGKTLKIENSNNEIWKNIANSSKFLTYENDGEKISFSGTFIDAECTISTNGKNDLEKFYLKAPKTWNTDATGKSLGAEQSTDMNGNHRAAIPYLNIVRAVSGDFAGLLDEHKNRVANYDGEKRFIDVTDSCPPVLVAVRTGQELHEDLPENQKPYDSHNFLEFQYSEEIKILDGKIDSSALNVQSSENFGGMKNNSSGSGFVVAGLVQFEKGKISLGSESGAAPEKLNSLYRNFAISASDAASPQNQTHRFRISLAGYQSQSAAENPSGFPYWPGYIDSENTQIPSGKIVQLSTDGTGKENGTESDFNDFIKDSEGNSLLVKSKENHEIQTLSVISESAADSFVSDWSDSVYGSWDLSAPVFALYHSLRSNSRQNYETCEILGACESSDTVLNRVEFHVFDNSEESFSKLGAEWYSQFGWGKNKSTLFSEDSYASDIFGGSRPFGNSAGDLVRTSGGIRYSTIYNKSSYFKYGVDSDSPETEFKDSIIKSGASSSLFLSQIRKPREISSNDSLYFSIFLKDGTNLPLKTNFSIKFDEKACVTDLAGNLMKSATVKSVDLVPPRFNMTSAKISGNKLYVVFNKKLSLEPVELENSDGATDSFGIADSLRFIKIPENPHKFDDAEDVVSDLFIEKEIPPQETYSSDTFTGLIFTLNRNVTLDDVKNYYIQCFSPGVGKFVDPFTGIKDVKVTSVTDINGIYMTHGEAHALSDFAVNVVNPVYAYDDRFVDENFGFSPSDAKQSNLSVHDWNKEQQNDGTLLTEHDIFVVTSQDSGSSESAETLPEKIIMYYDNEPDSDSVSSEYNKNLDGNLRVWIPSFVPCGEDSNSSMEKVSPFLALAPSTNSRNLFVSGEIDKSVAKFAIDWETLSKNGYSSGNQVSFLFGLADSDGSATKICHAPVYDEISGIYKLEKQPLFALRLKNSDNPASLDLWSFKLKDVALQRGNVTIFNNVIDANQGEMSVVRVNMPSEGKLDVIVMTLDGNVVRYLQHGTASAGEHNYSWNGTTKSGKKVARGLYFVRVFGNGIDETRKIMVVKN